MPKKSKELKNLEDKLARALADYQNLEKRFERDSSSIIQFGQASLLGKLIDFRDHLELAVNSGGDNNLSLLLEELDKLLKGEGVQQVDTTAAFDPTLMECTELVVGAKDQIVTVSRPGFTLRNRLLRPARVQVGSGITKSNK